MKKQNLGVTLIALVITIIVLLILAGVSMSVIFGDNNLFEKAQLAKSETENSVEKEYAQLETVTGLLARAPSEGSNPNGGEGSEEAVAIVKNGTWDGVVNTPKTEGTGLRPVYWNGTEWAALTNANTKEDWYDYSNQKWANAQTADGSLWVWIPRYEYKIDSVNKTIAINFI